MTTYADSQTWSELMRAMSRADLAAEPAPSDPAEDPQARRVGRAIGGCNHARAVLLRDIEGPCYRFCLTQLGCPDRARDATQETALRLLRSLRCYRGDAAFTTWALSIALNVCREYRRKRRWFALPNDWSKPDPSPSPQQQADHAEQTSQALQRLQQLPPRQREAVTLRYLQGLSTAETAQVMRCAEGTVKATLAKGLYKLRQSWGQDDA